MLIGNGDIKSIAEAKKIVKKSGLDGVMIGRGVLGDPWFFSGRVPGVSERLNAIIKHAEIFDSFYKEDIKKNGHYKQFESLKKHFHAYTKGFKGAKDLRDKLMKVKNTVEVKRAIEDFLK